MADFLQKVSENHIKPYETTLEIYESIILDIWITFYSFVNSKVD